MKTEPPNPIVQRLDRLRHLWMQFSAQPEARICRWFLREDEVTLFRGFVESTNNSETSQVSDIFFPFETPYSALESYSGLLVQELAQRLENDREALVQEGVHVTWRPQEPAWSERNRAAHFLHNFAAFAADVKLDGLAVAFLDPATRDKNLEKWLFEAVEAGIPATVRLMVFDVEGENIFERVAKQYPQQVKTLTPELDMPAAIRQLASAGNPADPGVKFRRAYIDLSQAVAKGDLAQAQRLQTLPLSIAREQNWMHLEVGILALMAAGYLGAKRYDEADQHYEQARQIAHAAAAQGNELGVKLEMQMLFGKGSVAISRKDYKAAGPVYHQAAVLGESAGDPLLWMEACRMEGFSHEQSGQTQPALQAYRMALQVAEKMDEPLRHNSTLPYTGRALLDLAHRLGYKEEYFRLQQQMNALAGPGWENKVEKRRSAV